MLCTIFPCYFTPTPTTVLTIIPISELITAETQIQVEVKKKGVFNCYFILIPLMLTLPLEISQINNVLGLPYPTALHFLHNLYYSSLSE